MSSDKEQKHKHKHSTEHNHASGLSELLDKEATNLRLNKIKGQIEGIMKMIDRGDYCLDLINQCKAVRGAIYKVEEKILEAHLKTCVVEAIKTGDSEDIIEDILNVYRISPGKNEF